MLDFRIRHQKRRFIGPMRPRRLRVVCVLYDWASERQKDGGGFVADHVNHC